LQKDAVQHFIQGAVASNNNQVPVTLLSGLPGQVDGMIPVPGQKVFMINACLLDQMHDLRPLSGPFPDPCIGIYNDQPAIIRYFGAHIGCEEFLLIVAR